MSDDDKNIVDLEVLVAKKGTTIHANDDTWYEFDPKECDLKLACCDCGLVHNFKVEPFVDFKDFKDKIRIQFTVNDEATNIIREKKETWIQKNTVLGWKIIKENNND